MEEERQRCSSGGWQQIEDMQHVTYPNGIGRRLVNEKDRGNNIGQQTRDFQKIAQFLEPFPNLEGFSFWTLGFYPEMGKTKKTIQKLKFADVLKILKVSFSEIILWRIQTFQPDNFLPPWGNVLSHEKYISHCEKRKKLNHNYYRLGEAIVHKIKDFCEIIS